jgi:lysophospholipase L1-like esterase
MKALLSILLTIVALSSCAKKQATIALANSIDNSDSTHIAPADSSSVSYLALGDSYTIGQSVTQNESFPYQLSAGLAQYGFKKPVIIAQTGWTTNNLINAINNSTVKNQQFDFVTLLIGVNDQYGGGNPADYKPVFIQVLNMAIKLAGGNKSHVIVLSIPDYGVTPYAGGNESTIGPQIDAFNAINQAESMNAGVRYVDITAISKMAVTDPSLITYDGLHPSAKMYALWVQKMLPEFIALLGK